MTNPRISSTAANYTRCPSIPVLPDFGHYQTRRCDG